VLIRSFFTWISDLCCRSPRPHSRNTQDCGDARWVVLEDDVRASFHEEGIALLNLATGKVFLSNEIGSRIWRGLAAGLSPRAIGEELSREFGVALDLVEQHTSSFLNELIRRGLVVKIAVNG